MIRVKFFFVVIALQLKQYILQYISYNLVIILYFNTSILTIQDYFIKYIIIFVNLHL